MSGPRRFFYCALWVVSTLGAVALAACSHGRGPAPRAPVAATSCYEGGVAPPDPLGNPGKERGFEGPMPVVEASKMQDELASVGLDIKHLPPFEQIERRQLRVVMKSFSDSLGITCAGCHDLEHFKASTPRKRVAKKMWNEFARVLSMSDGQPVYCDGCHQGRPYLLDHAQKKLVADYMDDVFIGKLKRSDGAEHDCGTCHGDPPEFHFLTDWKKGS